MKVSIGPIQEIATVEAEALNNRKANTVNAENMKAGESRKKYLTEIPGQQMIYLRKEQEAKDWLTGIIDKTAENFPFIFNEVGLTGDTPDQVAQVFLNSSYMWIQLALVMEKDRLLKIQSIKDANTDEELRIARDEN